MTDDVSTDGPGGVSEERVGFRRDLVGDGDDRVVHGGEVEQVVHVAVAVLNVARCEFVTSTQKIQR